MNKNPEFEQSVLRIIGIVIVAVYIFVLTNFKSLPDSTIVHIIEFGVIYLSISVVILLLAGLGKGYTNLRRVAGIVLDILMTSVYLSLLSEYGAPLFAVYLWVTIGNGFRYGVEYLLASALLSIIGFLWVATSSPFWSELPAMVATGVVVLTVVPVYVAVLLRRLQTEKIRAEAANREKSRFIANISHEIRTPLNAVAGFSELLSETHDKAHMKRLIKGIRNSARSLTALVDGVLEFSKIEAGCIELDNAPFEVGKLLEGIESVFSLQADNKGINFSCETGLNVPAVINGDINRIRQILVNLVGNAMKFTDTGHIRLMVTRQSDQRQGDMIRFDVQDSGIGIKEDMQPYIFDRFRQADDSTQRSHGGAGLGTAISKHLVKLMGGQIGLESIYGRGSTFWFTIPCQVAHAMGVLSAPSVQGQAESGQLQTNERSIRVLVAEDNEMNRHVFRGMLKKLGVSAIIAESGPVALGKLMQDKFDLIMLDIQMPGMSGFDVISQYNQETDISKRVPIVVVTGDATADVKAQCNQLGVSRFLTKPVELDELRRVVSELAGFKDQAPASV